MQHADIGSDVPDPWARASWRSVLAGQVDPHPFATPEWPAAWWEHFGTGELAVLELCDGGELAGVAALQRRPGGPWRAVGDRRLTDYPGPVVLPGRAPAAAAALVDVARRGGGLELVGLRPEDGLVDALQHAAAAAGLGCLVVPDEPVSAMALPDSWERYVGGLSRHARHELARKRRRLARERPSARVRTADASSLREDLDCFIALHRRARGPKARFFDLRTERFVRTVADRALADGTLRLDLLEADGLPLAATLGFRSPRTFHLYNMAFDPAVAALSPGIVLVGALVERAIEEGLARFDFLRGGERYKLELGGVPSRLARVRVPGS